MMNQDDDFRAMLARAAAQLPNKPSPAKPVPERPSYPTEEAPPTPLGDGTLDARGMESLAAFRAWAGPGILREGRSDREHLDFLLGLYEAKKAERDKRKASRRSSVWPGRASASALLDMTTKIQEYLRGQRYDDADVETIFDHVVVTFKRRGATAANEAFQKWAWKQRDAGGQWKVLSL